MRRGSKAAFFVHKPAFYALLTVLNRILWQRFAPENRNNGFTGMCAHRHGQRGTCPLWKSRNVLGLSRKNSISEGSLNGLDAIGPFVCNHYAVSGIDRFGHSPPRIQLFYREERPWMIVQQRLFHAIKDLCVVVFWRRTRVRRTRPPDLGLGSQC